MNISQKVSLFKSLGVSVLTLFILSCTGGSQFRASTESFVSNISSNGASDFSVLSPAEGSVLASQKIVLSGQCAKDESTITIESSAINLSQSVDCENEAWSSEINIDPQVQGLVSLNIISKDKDGKVVKKMSRTVVRDSVAPELVISKATQVDGGFQIEGRCETQLPIFVKGVNLLQSESQASCESNGLFSMIIFVTPEAGVKNITLDQIDLASNKTTVNKDLTYVPLVGPPKPPEPVVKPTVTFDSPVEQTFVNSLNVKSFKISGSCSENGRAVVIGGSSSGQALCNSKVWSSTFNLESVSDGTLSFQVSQQNAAGTKSEIVNRSFTKDATLPTIFLTSPAQSTHITSTSSYTLVIKGSCSDNGTNNIILNDSSAVLNTDSSCVSGLWQKTINFTSFANGNIDINFKIKDAAGNISDNKILSLIKDAAVVVPPAPQPDPPPPDNSISCDGQLIGVAATATKVSDLSYGLDALQKFDLFLPSGSGPFPLVVLIHGGGFIGGDKADYSSTAVDFTKQGIAAVSVNYRFANAATGSDIEALQTEGSLRSIKDGQRALQFIRCHSKELKINPNKVVLFGSSAGASMSLWIGLQNNLAKPASKDPIERMSTRVNGIVANNTQSSLDGAFFESEVFKEYPNFSVDLLSSRATRLYHLIAYNHAKFFSDPAIISYRQNVHLIDFMSSDDPEIWVSNTLPKTDPTDSTGPDYGGIHHPNHVLALKKRGDQVGIVGSYSTPAVPENNLPVKETSKDFVIRKLQENTQSPPTAEPPPVVKPTVTFTSPGQNSELNSTTGYIVNLNGSCSVSSRAVSLSGSYTGESVCQSGFWSKSIDFSAAASGQLTVRADHSNAQGVSATSAVLNLTKIVPPVSQPPEPVDNTPVTFKKNTNYTGFVSSIDGNPSITNTLNLTVTNGNVATALINLIKTVGPGTRIIIPDGTYQDQLFNFSNADCPKGLANKPIIIQAATAGGVIFKGSSGFLLCGEYIVIQGISFIGPKPNAQPGVTTASVPFKVGTSFNGVYRYCDYCALRKILIDDYSVQDAPDAGSTWIYISYDSSKPEQPTSKGLEVSDSRFINKKNYGVILYWSVSKAPPAHHIYRNYFSRPPPSGKEDNGLEAIRVGDSFTSSNTSNSIIEHNVFERSNGDAEDVSIKSDGNIVRYNTFINSSGTLSVRIGNKNIFEGNYFVGDNVTNTGGIRISGSDNLAIGNHFQGLKYGGTQVDPGGSNQVALGLYNGDGQVCTGAAYCAVVRAFVVGNAFFKNDTNLVLGEAYKSTRTVVPTESVIAHNLFDTTGMKSQMIFNRNADLAGYVIEGNAGQGAPGINVTSGALEILNQLQVSLNGSLNIKVPTTKKDLDNVRIYQDRLQKLGLAPDLLAKIKMINKNIYEVSLPLTSSDVGQTSAGY